MARAGRADRGDPESVDPRKVQPNEEVLASEEFPSAGSPGARGREAPPPPGTTAAGGSHDAMPGPGSPADPAGPDAP